MRYPIILLLAFATLLSNCSKEALEIEIKSIHAYPDSVFACDTVELIGAVLFQDSDWIQTIWYYQGRTLAQPIWIAPKEVGDHYIFLEVRDQRSSDIDSVCIHVRDTMGTFVDARDKHEYKWVKIGEQIWMAENMAYLPDVEELPTFTEGGPFYFIYAYAGRSVKEAKQYWAYANYGVLYNRAATMTSLCPEGWRLPDEQDWNVLFAYVGEPIGAKLKSLEEWGQANEGLEVDRSGLKVRPAGTWQVHGSPGGATWLTSEYQGQRTYLYHDDSHYLLLTNTSNEVSVIESVVYSGHSVRCIKVE